jgi:hypothetical protein
MKLTSLNLVSLTLLKLQAIVFTFHFKYGISYHIINKFLVRNPEKLSKILF